MLLEMTSEVVIEDVYVETEEPVDPAEDLIGISLGVIIGIAIGAAVVVALISLTIYVKRKNRITIHENN